MIVADTWLGRGLGDLPMRLLLDIAKKRGITRIWEVVHPNNRRPAPKLAQHTGEILNEAGFNTEEIDQLCLEKVVFLPKEPA